MQIDLIVPVSLKVSPKLTESSWSWNIDLVHGGNLINVRKTYIGDETAEALARKILEFLTSEETT